MTIPLNLAALVVLVRVALWRSADPWLRLIALATLVQQCVGLFFILYSRYYYLTWLLTLLVVTVWIDREGMGMLRRRFPAFSEWLVRHRLSAALARGLARAMDTLDEDPSASEVRRGAF